MKRYYSILIFSMLVHQALSQENNTDYAEAFQLVEVWLEAQKDFDHLPGITAAVVRDQEVLWSGGVGLANVESGIKANASILCSICSISKLFTAVAVMKLYDEGKLRLDDLVSDLLPTFTLEQKFPGSGPITIRSLLTHSSGLPREAAFPYWTGPDFPFPSREQIDESLSEQETLYPASTYFQYSNLALTLLGEIVEEISGESYDDYIQDHILTPLELNNTRTELPEERYGNDLALGYSAISRMGKREKVNFFQANGISPAAGFSSNVLDLGKFASWQFRLRDGNLPEILRPSTLKNMQNVHWTDPDWKTTSGLGFSIYKGANGNTWVGHGGSCPGYRSTLQMDLKTKTAYAVMINAGGTNPSKYVNGIYAILKKAASSTTLDSSNEHKELKEYIGFYNVQPWWAEVYISTWDDKLVTLKLPSQNPGRDMTFYKHIEGDVFRRIRDDETLGETLVFERGKDGGITHYKTHRNYVKKMDR